MLASEPPAATAVKGINNANMYSSSDGHFVVTQYFPIKHHSMLNMAEHYHHLLPAAQVGPVLGSEAFVGSFIGIHQELPNRQRARTPLQHAASLRKRHNLG